MSHHFEKCLALATIACVFMMSHFLCDHSERTATHSYKAKLHHARNVRSVCSFWNKPGGQEEVTQSVRAGQH